MAKKLAPIDKMLFLSSPGRCEACGREHEPAHPHDMDSQSYARWFYAQHCRFPTWADAMAHCPDHEKEAWTWALKALEIDLNTPYFGQPDEVITNG